MEVRDLVTKSWRQLAVALAAGAMMTVLVAWCCALWSPWRYEIDPFADPVNAVATADPNGEMGLHFQECAVGWTRMTLRGEIHWHNGKPDFLYPGPYGGTYHQFAGWPFKALRSCVTVLDSQAANRVVGGEGPDVIVIQRRRWELPWDEIVHRGVASNDLPAWMHAQYGRRLALVPIPLGFMANSLFYALFFTFAARLAQSFWNRFRSRPAGFDVILEPMDNPLN